MQPPTDLTEPASLHRDRKTLQIIALAVCLGVVAISMALAGLVAAGGGLDLLTPDPAFYIAAALSIASILAGFAVQRRLADTLLPAANGYVGALYAIKTNTIVSFGAMEAGAIGAALMGFLSSTLAPFAFVLPFFAFALMFFPTEGRFRYWLASASL